MDLIYTALFKSHSAALPSLEPLTMTDHDLEAATQRIVSLCTRIIFESDMLKPLDPELREKRHSLTMWSSDPVMRFSESAKVAQVHAIPSTTWVVCTGYKHIYGLVASTRLTWPSTKVRSWLAAALPLRPNPHSTRSCGREGTESMPVGCGNTFSPMGSTVIF